MGNDRVDGEKSDEKEQVKEVSGQGEGGSGKKEEPSPDKPGEGEKSPELASVLDSTGGEIKKELNPRPTVVEKWVNQIKERIEKGEEGIVLDILVNWLPKKWGGALQLPDYKTEIYPWLVLLEEIKKRCPAFEFVFQRARESLKEKPPAEVFRKTGRAKGVLLYLDVCQFTAKIQEWTDLKKEGAERLLKFLNEVFRTLEKGEIKKYGGQVLKFGGDSVTIFFPETKEPSALKRAEAFAFKTQKEFEKNPERLEGMKVRIGLGEGEFSLGIAGGPNRLEVMVGGELYQKVKELRGEPGGIRVLGEEEDLQEKIDLEPDFNRSEMEEVNLESSRDISKDAKRIAELLLPLLPRGSSGRRLEGEYGRAVVCFADFEGIDFDRLTSEEEKKLNQFLTRLDQIVTRYGGRINKIEGNTIFIVFGVQGAQVENQVPLGSELVLALQKNLELPLRIGLSYGEVCAAPLGVLKEEARLPEYGEFAVVGDRVNLAARAKQEAPLGQILICENVYQKLKSDPNFEIEVEKLPPREVKGFKEPQKFYLLKKIERKEKEKLEEKMEGREEEKKEIARLIEKVYQEVPQTLLICAEAGMGKSRLLQEVMDQWEIREGMVLKGAAEFNQRWTSYFLWQKILQKLFGLSREDSAPVIKAKIEQFLKSERLELDFGLISQFLTFEKEKEKKDIFANPFLNLYPCLLELFRKIAQKKPLLLALEDLQWLDPGSLEFLGYLMRNLPGERFLIAGTLREKSDPEFHKALFEGKIPSFTQQFKLGFLPVESVRSMIGNLLKSRESAIKLDDDLVNFIQKTSQGNPLFIQELVYALAEREKQLKSTGEPFLLREEKERLKIDSLEDITYQRFENLRQAGQISDSGQQVLEVASVLGGSFDLSVLKEICTFKVQPQVLNEEDFEKALSGLLGLDLLRRENGRISFRHEQERSVYYARLMKEVLVPLHRRAGEMLEYSERKVGIYQELFRHFKEAEILEKAFRYGKIAGDEARMHYQNSEAMFYLNEALKIGKKLSLDEPGVKEILVGCYLGMGEVAERAARYGEAILVLEEIKPFLKSLIERDVDRGQKKSYFEKILSSQIIEMNCFYSIGEKGLEKFKSCFKETGDLIGQFYREFYSSKYPRKEIWQMLPEFYFDWKIAQLKILYREMEYSKVVELSETLLENLERLEEVSDKTKRIKEGAQLRIGRMKAVALHQFIRKGDDYNLRRKWGNNFPKLEEYLREPITLLKKVVEAKKRGMFPWGYEIAEGPLATLLRLGGKFDEAREILNTLFKETRERGDLKFMLRILGEIVICYWDECEVREEELDIGERREKLERAVEFSKVRLKILAGEKGRIDPDFNKRVGPHVNYDLGGVYLSLSNIVEGNEKEKFLQQAWSYLIEALKNSKSAEFRSSFRSQELAPLIAKILLEDSSLVTGVEEGQKDQLRELFAEAVDFLNERIQEWQKEEPEITQALSRNREIITQVLKGLSQGVVTSQVPSPS